MNLTILGDEKIMLEASHSTKFAMCQEHKLIKWMAMARTILKRRQGLAFVKCSAQRRQASCDNRGLFLLHNRIQE